MAISPSVVGSLVKKRLAKGGVTGTPGPPLPTPLVSSIKVKLKILQFNVDSSFSYEAGISGSRRCALYPHDFVSAPSYMYFKVIP